MPNESRKDFFKKLAQSIHSKRQLAITQQQAQDTHELIALKNRLRRLKPYGEVCVLDEQCVYHHVQHLLLPNGSVISVPIQKR